MDRIAIVLAMCIGLAAGCCCQAQDQPSNALAIGLYSGEWDSADHLYPFVTYDEVTGKYTMYYTGSGRYWMNDSTWGPRMVGMATSDNGTSWAAVGTRRPVVYSLMHKQGDVLNPKDMSAIFDSAQAVGACVIKDGDRYKMWYTGWNGDVEHVGGGVENQINYRIGYATSADGARWTKQAGDAGAGSVLGVGGLADRDCRGAGQPSVIKENGLYRMWYEGFDGVRWRILYAVSRDGANWKKHGVAVDVGERGSTDQLGARNPVIVKRKGGYELWYQGISVGLPRCHVLRATSKDGVTWSKVPGEVELHVDRWLDSREDLHVDSVIVQEDDSCRVYFAKRSPSPRQIPDGPTVHNPRYQVYTEVINP